MITRMTSSLSAELAESSISDSPSPKTETTNLESLIARRKWNKVRALLDSEEGTVFAKHASRDILHILYASNPPLDVVTDLLGLCGNRVQEEDSTGRTPLHMATASAANVSVVEPLISMYPAAAGLPDCRGENPLMLASAHGKGASKSLIKALIRASPHTVIDEDDEGMSALEYALLSEVPRDVFRMLQKACAKERKKRDEKARAARAEATQQKLMQLSSRKLATPLNYTQEVHNSTRSLGVRDHSQDSMRSLTGRAA